MTIRRDSAPVNASLDGSPAHHALPAHPNRKPSVALRRLLADNVIRLRHSRGLTQQELARACGCGTGVIGDIERAALNVTLATLETLTIGLDCWPADLLTPLQRRTAPNSPRVPEANPT